MQPRVEVGQPLSSAEGQVGCRCYFWSPLSVLSLPSGSLYGHVLPPGDSPVPPLPQSAIHEAST